MKHIFLTGEIQIGKSTVIQKALSIMQIKFGGFRTYFGDDRNNPNRCLYINKAGMPSLFDEAHVVARFSRASLPKAYPERFDSFGEQYITDAASNSDLIIMDELGNLEDEAVRFQNAVLVSLEGTVPIFGVVKLTAAGWVEQIRSHPKVELITVDQRNRDILPKFLAGII